MPDDATQARPAHARLLAVLLFFLAPLIGEYLLGNTSLVELPAILFLAPMYGGGALLIREVTRRTGHGWPTMVLLAAAYALIEEGPIDQLLWNPHYGGIDFGTIYAETRVDLLGTSVQLLQDILTLHTVWSICVPIAIVEALGRGDRRPWLRPFGLIATAVIFVGGSLLLTFAQIDSEDFVATPGQFAGATVAIVALIATAFLLPRSPSDPEDKPAPPPLVVGVAAAVATSLYWGYSLVPHGISPWVQAGFWILLVVASVLLVERWSRREGWGARHRLALATGAAFTYAWVGVDQARYLDVATSTALLGNAIFIATVGALLMLGWYLTTRTSNDATPSDNFGENGDVAVQG